MSGTETTLRMLVQAETEAAERNVRRLAGDLDDAADSGERASTSMRDTGRETGELGEHFGETASRSAQVAGGLGDLGGALGQMGGPLGAVGSGMELLGPSIMGVTGAADLLEVVTTKLSWSNIKNAASTVASRIATVASTVATNAASLATRAWTLVQAGFNAVMSANPIILVTLAIVALVAAAVIAYNKVGWFRDLVQLAFGAIVSAGKALASFFTVTIPHAFAAFWGYIVGLWNKVKGFLATWGVVALAVLVPFLGIPLLIYKHFGQIVGWLRGVWSTVRTDVSNLVSSVVRGIAGIPGAIGGVAGKMLSAGKGLITSLFTGIKNALTGAGSMAGDIGSKIVDAAKSALNSFLHLPLKLPRMTIYNPIPGADDFHIGGQTLLNKFAQGTGYAAGGLALVGELGPELVRLPGGSQVTTAAGTRSRLGMANSGGGVTVVVQAPNLVATRREVLQWLTAGLEEAVGAGFRIQGVTA